MKKLLARILKPFSSSRKTKNFFEKIYAFSLFGLMGDEWDFNTNGELGFLNELSERMKGPLVVFDVGANKGEYTASIISIFGKHPVTVHGFEPAKEAFAIYSAKFGSDDHVIKNNIGLGEKQEDLTLYTSTQFTGVASVYADNKFKWDATELISIDTVDNYCGSRSITTIHFLKMDVEGNELNVLKGARKMLEEDRIQVIQFEFGAGNISSRTYFADFYRLLENKYRIFRIVKDGLIEIKKYDYKLEIFGRISNYVAVHRSNNWRQE